MPQPSARYTPAAKALHWLVAPRIIVQYTTAFVLPHIGRKTPPSDIISLHFSMGVLIMLVMLVRLGHRLLHPVALEAGDAAPWERLLAKMTHRVIYLIQIVSPVLGWASASAHSLAACSACRYRRWQHPEPPGLTRPAISTAPPCGRCCGSSAYTSLRPSTTTCYAMTPPCCAWRQRTMRSLKSRRPSRKRLH